MHFITLFILSILHMLTTGQSSSFDNQSNTEELNYKVIKTFDKFEIRTYEPALFSSVKLTKKGYRENSSDGFRVLAGYIFGDNDRNQKIAMTSPVVMELGDTSKMLFMIPSNLELNQLPSPNNSKIAFEQQGQRILAAIRFDGFADNEKIEQYKTILIEELTKANIKHSNQFSFLGYDPPYQVENRRNEIVVELIDYK